MTRGLHRCCLWLGSAFLLVLTSAGAPWAQDKVAEKHSARDLSDALKEVINTGAELFNKFSDHAGCYRLYQGALLSVKPFLAPELQKSVQEALKDADGLPRMSDRAFRLRKMLDQIREQAKGTAGQQVDRKKDEPKTEDKKKAEDKKKVEDKKPDVKKVEDKKKVDGKTGEEASGQLSGKVTFDGKPAPGGFVTLVAADKRRYSTSIRTGGVYQFKTRLPVGEYKVAIERAPDDTTKDVLPARYRNEQASGLVIRIQAGMQTLDLDLRP